MDVWIYSIANVSRMECELGEAIYDGNGIQSEQMWMTKLLEVSGLKTFDSA